MDIVFKKLEENNEKRKIELKNSLLERDYEKIFCKLDDNLFGKQHPILSNYLLKYLNLLKVYMHHFYIVICSVNKDIQSLNVPIEKADYKKLCEISECFEYPTITPESILLDYMNKKHFIKSMNEIRPLYENHVFYDCKVKLYDFQNKMDSIYKKYDGLLTRSEDISKNLDRLMKEYNAMSGIEFHKYLPLDERKISYSVLWKRFNDLYEKQKANSRDFPAD